MEPQPSFEFGRCEGGVAEEEMYRRFKMGTGCVAAVAAGDAEALADATDGRVIGRVEAGAEDAGADDGASVAIRGLEL